MSVQATFLQEDTTTQGNWIGTYRAQGYEVISNATSLPSYATVTPSGQQTWTWTTSTTDPRAFQDAGGVGEVAACWYSGSSFTVAVNLSDGQAHNLELYFDDWDQTGRSEQVQITSSAGTVLDTENISSFSNGEYLDWTVSGSVVIKITRTAGNSAVLNGLFLDPATTNPAITTDTSTDPTNAVFDDADASSSVSSLVLMGTIPDLTDSTLRQTGSGSALINERVFKEQLLYCSKALSYNRIGPVASALRGQAR